MSCDEFGWTEVSGSSSDSSSDSSLLSDHPGKDIVTKMVKIENSDHDISKQELSKKSKKKPHKVKIEHTSDENLTVQHETTTVTIQSSTPLSTRKEFKTEKSKKHLHCNISKISNEENHMSDSFLKKKHKRKEPNSIPELTYDTVEDKLCQSDNDNPRQKKKKNKNKTTKEVFSAPDTTLKQSDNSVCLDESEEIQEKETIPHKDKKKHSKKKDFIRDRPINNGDISEDTNSISEKRNTDSEFSKFHNTNQINIEIEREESISTNNQHDYSDEVDKVSSPHTDKHIKEFEISLDDQIEKDPELQNLHKKNTNFAERIQFEDDDIDHLTDKLTAQYLRNHPNLEPLSSSSQNLLISEDDEVWIVKCPSELPIKALQNQSVKLESKSKIKLNGQTYDSFIEEEDNRIAMLTGNKAKFQIKNVNPVASIHFRKRLPKPHFSQSSIIENLQTNFIPLPETKTRHPLFGHDYKHYIKLPSSIKEKLNQPKRKQKEKNKVIEEVVESESSNHKKKKRKRKLSSNEETLEGRPKKIKKDPDYQKVWDSTEAIEESLFNF